MVTSYQVQVNRRGINQIYLPRGSGYRWLDRVNLQMFRACVAAAPSRSGELKAGHRASIRAGSQNYVRAEVVNVAKHSEWVHNGTYGPIFPRTADLLWVPVRRGSASRTLRPSVNGQAAQPWMEDACTRVALIHGGRVIS